MTLIQSDEIIEMGEEPVKAIRRKNKLFVMQHRAVNGEAEAIFSAGNTGALLVGRVSR